MGWRATLRPLLPPGLRPADPLGNGVWQRAALSAERVCGRFSRLVEAVPAGDVRSSLDASAQRLEALAAAVRQEAARAQAGAPSASFEVPGGGWQAVHRRLTRTTTVAAQAVEAAGMARVAALAGDDAGAEARAQAAARAVDDAEAVLAGRR